MIGGSLRRSAWEQHAAAARRWGICEVVAEAWDPEDAEDRSKLRALADDVRIHLHALALNPLARESRPGSLERARGWCEALGLRRVSDHFAWVGGGDSWPSLFLPPVASIGSPHENVERLRDRLGVELELENVFIGARDPSRLRAYHELFVDVARRTGCPVLLDLENLRLDAAVAGIEANDLFELYRDIAIAGYHVAGSRLDAAGGVALDTHDREVPLETLALARAALARVNAPVFYERDSSYGPETLEKEVARIQSALEEA